MTLSNKNISVYDSALVAKILLNSFKSNNLQMFHICMVEYLLYCNIFPAFFGYYFTSTWFSNYIHKLLVELS